jgi:hypothetical protein
MSQFRLDSSTTSNAAAGRSASPGVTRKAGTGKRGQSIHTKTLDTLNRPMHLMFLHQLSNQFQVQPQAVRQCQIVHREWLQMHEQVESLKSMIQSVLDEDDIDK